MLKICIYIFIIKSQFFKIATLVLFKGDTAHFLTAFSNFDFGVAMMFMKDVFNKDC